MLLKNPPVAQKARLSSMKGRQNQIVHVVAIIPGDTHFFQGQKIYVIALPMKQTARAILQHAPNLVHFQQVG